MPSSFPTVYRLLQSIGDRVLEFDPDTKTRLGKLANKNVRVELAGVPRPLFFQIQDQGIQVLDAWDKETHLTIKGSPLSFVRMVLLQGDVEIVESGVRIEGDAVLAQQFANLLKRVDIDWEEWLSQYLGDVGAHQAGNVLRDLSQWVRNTASTFEQNLSEYLTEEAQLLAQSQRVQAFVSAVDVMRADVDRLEQRIRRLSGHN